MKTTLQRTPLFERHQSLGARFREWGDWYIVEHFGQAEEEYEALRRASGLIDLGHCGRFKITGEERLRALNSLVTIDLEKLPPNSERKGFLCNDRGGIIDELSIFRGDTFLTVHSSSRTRRRVWEWLQSRMADFGDVEVTDSSETQTSIEVRGPEARRMMEEAILDGTVPLEDWRAGICQISQGRCLVTRIPADGTTTYRIDVGSYFVGSVWDRLVNVGSAGSLRPVGFRARHALRLELGVPTVGIDFDDNATPIEIGALDRIDFGKESFVGRDAILHSTAAEFTRRMVSLKFPRDILPEHGDPIQFGEIPIGYVTSAEESWRHNCGLGLGFVDALKSEPGTNLEIRTLANQMITAEVIEPGSLETSK